MGGFGSSTGRINIVQQVRQAWGVHRTGRVHAAVLRSHGPLSSAHQQLLPPGTCTCCGICCIGAQVPCHPCYSADQPRRRGEPRTVLPAGAQGGCCCF